MTDSAVIVHLVRFQEAERKIRHVRSTVFTQEQGIDAKLDFDGRDEECTQVLALDSNDSPVGTARMMADGHIGRIAVMADCRGQGVGRQLTISLVEAARSRGLSNVYLHAQVEAIGFYRTMGFEISGPRFMEAGIEHVRMVRQLESA